jgi:2-desacetyl-2-hydroxyethyl bacteriochlorophyllide A dehydrogenase
MYAHAHPGKTTLPSGAIGWEAAIVAPRSLEILPTAVPTLTTDEVLIRPEMIGICGTDLELYEGTMAYLVSGFAAYPIVPGHEWTGVVIGRGADVTRIGIGERVVGECSIGCARCARCKSGMYHLCTNRTETGIAGRKGALATHLVAPARSVHRVPQGVAPADAVLIEPLAVAYRAVSRLTLASEAAVAIVGAGTIGLLCALVARDVYHADVTLAEVDPHRLSFAHSLGFAGASSLNDSFSSVIEATGSPGGIRGALNAVAEGGSIVVVGLSGLRDVPIDLDGIVVRDVTLYGSLGSPGVWPAVIDLVAAGAVTPGKLISHTVPFHDAEAAFALASGREECVRKVVIAGDVSRVHLADGPYG